MGWGILRIPVGRLVTSRHIRWLEPCPLVDGAEMPKFYEED